jgi:hypothetical protein
MCRARALDGSKPQAHGSNYKDPGAAHFDRRDQAKLAKRLVRRL